MKTSNKKRLEKLEKFSHKMNRCARLIIYDPEKGPPDIEGDGVYLCLPDNGRRFPSHEHNNSLAIKP